MNNILVAEINEEFIRMDNLLKFMGLAETGGHAKIIIQNGEVLLNNEVCTQRGKKIFNNDKVSFNNITVVVKNKS